MIPSDHRSGIELWYCISCWVLECWNMRTAQVRMHFVAVSQQLVQRFPNFCAADPFCCWIFFADPLARGVHPPQTMMHFLPVSDSPISENFRTFWKILTILPFPEKFLDFRPPKFLMTFFLVIDHKFQIPPIFVVSVHFPPVSRKLFFPPYFYKFPLF